MSEQDLIELGFERCNETDPKIGDWYYYSSYWNGIDLISNASDEWDTDGLYVEVFDQMERLDASRHMRKNESNHVLPASKLKLSHNPTGLLIGELRKLKDLKRQ
jgi:hypothetical protein